MCLLDACFGNDATHKPPANGAALCLNQPMFLLAKRRLPARVPQRAYKETEGDPIPLA
jgi:hypothetical protein